MAENILLKGIRLFKKKDNQPEFVVAGGAITLNELVQFAKDNPTLVTEYNGQKQIKIQVLRSKDGNPYIAVDTFVPAQQNAATPVDTKPAEPIDDLPF